ncbi:YifB family Mg chelatase-like AAA ATPase [Candidatus Dependentiae bacterium]|nr:YifB family Mg chelatase-like AAA ATPase [Candidatus Dependentiae bacterium]
MLSKTFSGLIDGISGVIITIEADVSKGLPYFNIIGVADTSVKESKDRIRSAILNSQLPFPEAKITLNLAPASIRKEGASFDLGSAIAILSSGEFIENLNIEKYFFIGELLLSGEIKPVPGVMPLTLSALENKFEYVIVPEENKYEAGIITGIKVIPVKTLYQAVQFLNGRLEIVPFSVNREEIDDVKYQYDFSEIVGQNLARRGLEIASAGGHNILMVGPPGTGKTLMAKTFPSILPDMTFEEAFETTKIHSIAGLISSGVSLIKQRPFRNPHHTVSTVSLIGGGQNSKPGEVSLAHNGVLFLDEFPEFKRSALEVLRQPLEDGVVTVSRIKAVYTYPSKLILVAAMNPCPCGYLNHPEKNCSCSHFSIEKYLSKLSGPLLDRIDIHIEVLPVNKRELLDNKKNKNAESSKTIKNRVQTARNIQNERFKNTGIYCNAYMNKQQLKKFCSLTDEQNELLVETIEKFKLSARSYDKILKLSRTIADLEGKDKIDDDHLIEAVSFRTLDKNKWF